MSLTLAKQRTAALKNCLKNWSDDLVKMIIDFVDFSDMRIHKAAMITRCIQNISLTDNFTSETGLFGITHNGISVSITHCMLHRDEGFYIDGSFIKNNKYFCSIKLESYRTEETRIVTGPGEVGTIFEEDIGNVILGILDKGLCALCKTIMPHSTCEICDDCMARET